MKNKKAQFIDGKFISLAVGMLIVILIVPTILQSVFNGFQSPKIEDLIFPLIILAIFFEFIRRVIKL